MRNISLSVSGRWSLGVVYLKALSILYNIGLVIQSDGSQYWELKVESAITTPLSSVLLKQRVD